MKGIQTCCLTQVCGVKVSNRCQRHTWWGAGRPSLPRPLPCAKPSTPPSVHLWSRDRILHSPSRLTPKHTHAHTCPKTGRAITRPCAGTPVEQPCSHALQAFVCLWAQQALGPRADLWLQRARCSGARVQLARACSGAQDLELRHRGATLAPTSLPGQLGA